MKAIKLFSTLILFGFCEIIAAQEKRTELWSIDSLDRFNNASMPVSDGLTMWVTRQKLTLNGMQVYNKTELSPETQQTRQHIGTFIPVYHSGGFSSNIGMNNHNAYFLTDRNVFNKNIQYTYLFGAVQYNYNSWRLTASSEYYAYGNGNIAFTKKNNKFMPLFVAGYAFSKKWQLIFIGGYSRVYRETDVVANPIIAVQVRYQPNPHFKIIIGAPVICAVEWSIFSKVDLFYRYFMTNETQAYLRYQINKILYLSVNYNNTLNRSNEMYYNTKTINRNNQSYNFNNSKQLQHPISLELAFQTSKNIAITLTGGYNFGGQIRLKKDNSTIISIPGNNEYYIGFQANYLLLR
jgi:hypothetical protein